MNSDGANTPPEPPIHIVRLVASDLAASRPSSTRITYCPPMARSSTG